MHHQKRGIKWFQEEEKKERVNESGGSPQCTSKETEVEVTANARAEIWGDARPGTGMVEREMRGDWNKGTLKVNI